MQGLKAIGVTADQYGSFLIPVIMGKLPADVQLQIARVTTREVAMGFGRNITGSQTRSRG